MRDPLFLNQTKMKKKFDTVTIIATGVRGVIWKVKIESGELWYEINNKWYNQSEVK